MFITKARRWCLVFLSCAGAGVLANMPVAAAAADSGLDQVGDSKLSEIVVTAQKTVEKLQDVPAAVQVLSADQLVSQGLSSINEYAKLVPGLTIIGGGGVGLGFPVIRGLATGTDSTNLVSIFLDDISFTPNSSVGGNSGFIFDPDLADLDHIEVLEGPQSTLYGADAEGGIIKYVTKQPDLNNTTGSVQIEGSQVDSGGSGYAVRGAINIPIIDDAVALRASAFYRRDPGFVDNAYNGSTNVNWTQVEGMHLAILYKISDDLQTTLSGLVQHTYSPNPNEVYLDPQTLRPTLGAREFTDPERQTNAYDTRSLADVIKWDLHFATLSNLASYVNKVANNYSDAGIYAFAAGAPPGTLADIQNIAGSTRYTDELRLASAPGRVEYLLGAYITHETDYLYEKSVGTNSAGQVVDPSNFFYNIYNLNEQYLYREWAGFGNLTYHFTDQVQATVGLRYSKNSQNFADLASGIFAGPGIDSGNPSSDSATTYLGTISYQPVSALTAYLRAASAYRPGGSQYVAGATSPINYEPDSMWNYEAGVKGSMFNQRVSYTADVFDMRWKKLQLGVVANDLTYITNVGSARSEGAEASVQFIPVPGLTVALKAAYVDAIITADIPSLKAVNGQSMPYAAKWSGAAVADYRMNEFRGISPTYGLTYAYHGSSSTGFYGDSGVFGPASGVFQLPAYYTLDLRTGFDWSSYSFTARAINVTNRFGLTNFGFVTNYPPTAYSGTIVQPRTFSISMMKRF
jgi:iron complex outermembrane receptor protein